jgi:hypothetical protein
MRLYRALGRRCPAYCPVACPARGSSPRRKRVAPRMRWAWVGKMPNQPSKIGVKPTPRAVSAQKMLRAARCQGGSIAIKADLCIMCPFLFFVRGAQKGCFGQSQPRCAWRPACHFVDPGGRDAPPPMVCAVPPVIVSPHPCCAWRTTTERSGWLWSFRVFPLVGGGSLLRELSRDMQGGTATNCPTTQPPWFGGGSLMRQATRRGAGRRATHCWQEGVVSVSAALGRRQQLGEHSSFLGTQPGQNPGRVHAGGGRVQPGAWRSRDHARSRAKG